VCRFVSLLLFFFFFRRLEDRLFIGGELRGELLPDDSDSSLHDIDDEESRSLQLPKNKNSHIRLVVVVVVCMLERKEETNW
jgi:hypothetical protein